MIQFVKDQLVKCLNTPSMREQCHYTLEVQVEGHSYFDGDSDSWKIRLIPEGGITGDICPIMEVINSIATHVCVFVSVNNGGCLILV